MVTSRQRSQCRGPQQSALAENGNKDGEWWVRRLVKDTGARKVRDEKSQAMNLNYVKIKDLRKIWSRSPIICFLCWKILLTWRERIVRKQQEMVRITIWRLALVQAGKWRWWVGVAWQQRRGTEIEKQRPCWSMRCVKVSVPEFREQTYTL